MGVHAVAHAVEIKVNVAGGDADRALELLGLDGSDAKRRTIWFYDHVGGIGGRTALPLFHHNVIVRTRRQLDGGGDVTIKLRGQDLVLPVAWSEPAQRGNWSFKIEGDWTGRRRSTAASLSVDVEKLDAGLGAPALRVVTGRQTDFLHASIDLPIDLSVIEGLGPIDARTWSATDVGFDEEVAAERWHVGALGFFELSLRVAEADAVAVQRAFDHFLTDRHVPVSSMEMTKTETVLRASDLVIHGRAAHGRRCRRSRRSEAPAGTTRLRPWHDRSMTAAPWNLMTLAPLSPAMSGAMLGDAPIAVVAPDRDDRDAVRAALAEAELLIYDWRASATGLTAEDIAAAPRLAFIQQPSVGVPGHDIAALDAAGVPLANAAGFNAVAVAEWVLGALFGVARHLNWVERELRDGRWPQVDVIARGPIEIGGRRVGIVGFGPIAHAVVAPLLAMGCTVSYWSRSRRAPADERGATYKDLDELIATSDVLVNLIALGDETRGLLSATRLAALPTGALVVSASRGGIVDELAVLDAVERGAPRRRGVRRLRDRAAAGRQPAPALRPDPADVPHGRVDPGVVRPHGGPPQRQHPPGRHRPARPQRRQRARRRRAPALTPPAPSW